MKKSSTLILLSLLALLSFSCEPTPKEIADNKEKELIEEHDKAMAKIEHMQHTLGVLNKERTEFMLDSASHHAAHLEDCDIAIKDIQIADKAMMDWMHDYAKNSKISRTDDERIAFYNEEMVKIKDVNEKITISIKEGERFVHKFFIDKAEHKQNLEESKDKQIEKTDSTQNEDVEV